MNHSNPLIKSIQKVSWVLSDWDRLSVIRNPPSMTFTKINPKQTSPIPQSRSLAFGVCPQTAGINYARAANMNRRQTLFAVVLTGHWAEISLGPQEEVSMEEQAGGQGGAGSDQLRAALGWAAG